jgi:WD repeat-containing protein 61
MISSHADIEWLFSGSDDHRIVLHDVRAGSSTGSSGKGEGAVAIMQGHQGWVLKVASGPDGKLLGSGQVHSYHENII